MRKLGLLMALVSVLWLYPGRTQAATNCQENLLYKGSLFCVGEAIHWVQVDYRGSAEKIGLNNAGFEESLRKALQKDFSFMRQEAIRISAIYKMPVRERIKRGLFQCSLWTVGDDYPIAYHMACGLVGYGDGAGFAANLLKQEFLGVASKATISGAVRKNFDKAVADIAETFLKYRKNGSKEIKN